MLFTDSIGNPQQFRYYRIPLADWPLDIVATRDGGYALLTTQIGLLRLNANGDSLWSHVYTQYDFGYGGELAETEDGGFVLCGTRDYRRQDSTRGVQPWICKTDSLGAIVWERRIGTMGADWCRSLAPTDDGGYIIAGFADSTGYSAIHPFAARISASGDSLWAHVWNDVYAGLYRCRALPDGCFILFGLLISDSPYFTRCYVMKIDGEGNRLWERTYGYVTSVDAYALAVLSDGSLGIGGDQWNGATGYDAWAARTGLAVSSALPPAVIPESYSFLTNYPNPFNGTTQIEYTLPITQRVSLQLYDVLGREVAVLVDEIKTAGEHRVMLDAAGLASGVYLCRIEAGKFLQTRKIVLLR